METEIANRLWSEVSSLFRYATTQLETLDGTSSCFRLQKKGSHVVCEDSVLVRVEILQKTAVEATGACPTHLAPYKAGETAVLRMRLNDWFLLGQHVQELSAIWTRVNILEESVVLDSTIGPAFLAGYIPLAQHETLRMAEVFCGGFCGWTQAAYCLREGGVPIKTTWLLDNDAELIDSVEATHFDVKTLMGVSGFDEALLTDDVLFLRADIHDEWWHRVWAGRTPDLIAASPPCQPWSSAGNQSGLQSPDGVLFLTLASVAGMSCVPVVCVEEVKGFCDHPDAKHVLRAWADSGYQMVFQQVKNLNEVSPTHRPRLLMIFLHESTAHNSPAAFHIASWQPVPRPSLGSCKCYFKVLPDALHEPCKLSDRAREMYLDAWYMPPSCNHLDPYKFRVHKTQSRAPCFLAQYHYQHTLSEHLLETKGLLGGLLETPKGIRFYSAPEIATCHGVVSPLLFPLPDRVTMKVLGNSIAVPHAVLTLAHALQAFQGITKPDPAQLVHIAHQLRVKADHCALLRVEKGWLLAGIPIMNTLLARQALRREIELGLIRSRPVFHKVDLVPAELDEHDVLEVFFTEHVSPQEALEAFGFAWEKTVPVLQLDRPSRLHKVHIQEPPTLHLPSCLEKPNFISRAIAVLTPQGAACVDRAVPDIFAQLRWVFRWANDFSDLPVQCLDFYGRQLTEIGQMPALVLVVPQSDDILFPTPCLTPTQLQAITFAESESGIILQVHEDFAADWWAQWPQHVLPNLGWQTTFGRFPPAPGQPLSISVEPALTILRLRKPDLKRWLREVFFLGQIDQCNADSSRNQVAVTWQVGARTIAKGTIADDVTPADIEAWWFHASAATGCWPISRAFSGPFPLPVDHCLHALPDTSLFRKNGRIVLTIMPEVRGGACNTSLRTPEPVLPCLPHWGPLKQCRIALDIGSCDAAFPCFTDLDFQIATATKVRGFFCLHLPSSLPAIASIPSAFPILNREQLPQPTGPDSLPAEVSTYSCTADLSRLPCHGQTNGCCTLRGLPLPAFPIPATPCVPDSPSATSRNREARPSPHPGHTTIVLLCLGRMQFCNAQSPGCSSQCARVRPAIRYTPRSQPSLMSTAIALIAITPISPAASNPSRCLGLPTDLQSAQPMPCGPFSPQTTEHEGLFLRILKECISSYPCSDRLLVSFRVKNKFFGGLLLPGIVTPNFLENCWKLACQKSGAWPTARFYSGPFSLQFDTPLAAQQHRFFLKASFGIVLTVMPEIRGGGATLRVHSQAGAPWETPTPHDTPRHPTTPHDTPRHPTTPYDTP